WSRINGSPSRLSGPQGLKPAFLSALNGTAEAVPYPKPICETLFRAHLILFDLAVGHDPFPNVDRPVRKVYFEQAERHAAAILLGGLREFRWRSQRAKAAGEIFQSLFGEVTVAVISEQGAIDLTLLQRGKDFAGLILLLAGISRAEEQSRNVAGNVARRSDRVFIDEDNHRHTCVRKNRILRGK